MSSLANSTEDRRGLLLASTWTWTSVAIAFVSLRFYCRAILIRKLWWDDWLILAAVASTLAMSIVWTVYANYGGCRHAASLTPQQLIDTARLNWVSQPLCVSGLTTCKISVACLILRLQSPTRWRTLFLFGLCGLMVLTNITVVTLMFTQCTPVTLLWDSSSAPNGHCISPNVVAVMSQSASSYMAFIDLVLAAIPVHMIWNLQMQRGKKIAICILLSTGISAFGFAVVKIIELGNDSNHLDLTWATVWLFVWNAFEINLIIIAACIPTLVPLFEVVTGVKNSSHFSKKPNSGSAYFSKNTFRLRQRLDSAPRSDTESGKDILGVGVKNDISGNVSSINDIGLDDGSAWENSRDKRAQGQISVTKQWSVHEPKR